MKPIRHIPKCLMNDFHNILTRQCFLLNLAWPHKTEKHNATVCRHIFKYLEVVEKVLMTFLWSLGGLKKLKSVASHRERKNPKTLEHGKHKILFCSLTRAQHKFKDILLLFCIWTIFMVRSSVEYSSIFNFCCVQLYRKFILSTEKKVEFFSFFFFELCRIFYAVWDVILIWFNWNTHKLWAKKSRTRNVSSWNIHFSSHQTRAGSQQQHKDKVGRTKISYFFIISLWLCVMLSYVIMILEHHKMCLSLSLWTHSMWIIFNIEYMKKHSQYIFDRTNFIYRKIDSRINKIAA